MRNVKVVLTLFIFAIVFVCNTKNTFAYDIETCTHSFGGGFYDVGGVVHACNLCVSQKIRRGMIWFNNTPDDPYNLGAITNEPIAQLYLRGQYNQCGSTTTTLDGMNATKIRFLNKDGLEVSYLAQPSPSDVLNRSGNASALSSGSYGWSTPGGYIETTFTIDNNFINDAKNDGEETNDYYAVNVYVYRCPVAGASATSCGMDPVPIRVNKALLQCPVGQLFSTEKNKCCNDTNSDGVLSSSEIQACGGGDSGNCPSGQIKDPATGTCCADANGNGVCDNKESENLCVKWQGSTQANSASSNLGTTSVIAAAKNNGLKSPNWVQSIGNYGSYGDNDSKPIYAKPGDRIDFQNCYYGGEQKVANTQATYADDSDSCGYKAPKTAMKNIYDFDHGLSIESENFGANNDRDYFKDDDYNIGDSNTKSYSNSYTIDPFDVLDSYIYETDETTGITYAQAYSPETHTWVCKATCTCKAPDCGSCRTGLYDGLRLAGSQSCSGDETPAMAAISLSGLAEKSDISLVYLDGDGVSPGDDPHEDDWCECSDGCEERIKHCCGGEDSEDGWDESYECIQKRQESSHQVVPSDADDSEVGATITITVPYNFINTGTISLGETSSSIAYAGEDIKINTTLRVNTRRNNTTNGTYATIEEDSDVRIYTYSSTSNSGSEKLGVGNYGLDICSQLPYNRGNCNRVNSYDGQLNENGNMSGATYNHSDLFGSDNTYNIYDIPAGEYFCAVTAIFPYTTQGDTDVDMMSYDHSWYITRPACKVVHKKPSFQVWGGDVFSSGGIKAQYAAKNVLNGYIGYTPQSETNKTIFGSWVEFALIPNTTNDFVSSGAATGYTTDNNGNLIFNPGGNKTGISGIFCKNSPLTMMNKGCSGSSNSVPQNANMVADTSSKTEIYNSLVVPAKTTEPRPAGTWLNLTDSSSFTTIDKPYVRYTYVNGDAYITASQVMPTGVTHVVYATGNIVLGPGLQYSEGPYTDLSQVPQYVFYADKDIDIEHNVARVDGWLIAEGTVNTCTAIDPLTKKIGRVGKTDPKSNVQLKINGAVIAQKINFDRTYGASTGANSGVPAEIINLNVTHFLWSNSNTASKPSLRVVYTKELAPRY